MRPATKRALSFLAAALMLALLPSTARAAQADKLVVGDAQVFPMTRYKGDNWKPSQYTKWETQVRTSWLFSVRNPDKKRSAFGVKARLVFRDATGATITTLAVTVAREIRPGQTAWVAPQSLNTEDQEELWDDSDTLELQIPGAQSFDAQVKATRYGKPSKKSQAYVARDSLTNTKYSLTGYWFLAEKADPAAAMLVGNSATATVLGKKAKKVFSTWVWYDFNGTPVYALRLASSDGKGTFKITANVALSKTTSDQVASVRNYRVDR